MRYLLHHTARHEYNRYHNEVFSGDSTDVLVEPYSIEREYLSDAMWMKEKLLSDQAFRAGYMETVA